MYFIVAIKSILPDFEFVSKYESRSESKFYQDIALKFCFSKGKKDK